MKMNFLLGLISLFCSASLFGNDTTLVKVFFSTNQFKISPDEQKILDEVMPSDTAIVLKKIHIYGYCDSSEKENVKHTLSLQRATEVKKYLIKKGIPLFLIGTIEGKGKKANFESDKLNEDRKQVTILIEYEALIVDEPIIIKSSRKKQINDQ